MVRLKDIAAAAEVSPMTVSKALRDSPDIAVATRARIQALARQMGYVPDTAAQGLRTRSSKLIGLVISSVTNPIFARILMAMEDLALENGYDVLLAHSLNLPEREDLCIRRMLSRRVDGLFISPTYHLGPPSQVYEELRRGGTPTVILGHRAPFCQHFHNVETDDLTASHLVTRHLLELGHRRIAFLAGHPVSPAAQERFEGYRRALREVGIEVDDKLVFQAGGTIEEGQKAALQFLNENPCATAIQCVNDLVAIGAASTFLNQGLRIPQDLSITGFGNVLTAEHFRVPLTTVRQPKFRMGAAAMDIMLRMIRKEPTESRRLSAEMVVRQSTAPPSPSSCLAADARHEPAPAG